MPSSRPRPSRWPPSPGSSAIRVRRVEQRGSLSPLSETFTGFGCQQYLFSGFGLNPLRTALSGFQCRVGPRIDLPAIGLDFDAVDRRSRPVCVALSFLGARSLRGITVRIRTRKSYFDISIRKGGLFVTTTIRIGRNEDLGPGRVTSRPLAL